MIGVAPPGFTGDGVEPVDVWTPLNSGFRGLPPDWRENRDLNLVSLVARLKAGVSQAAAREDASGAYRRGLEIDRPATLQARSTFCR